MCQTYYSVIHSGTEGGGGGGLENLKIQDSIHKPQVLKRKVNRYTVSKAVVYVFTKRATMHALVRTGPIVDTCTAPAGCLRETPWNRLHEQR